MIRKLFAIIICTMYTATIFAAGSDFADFRTQRHIIIKQPVKDAKKYFSSAIDHFKNECDTANYLIAIAHMADVKHRSGEFNEAFEMLLDNIPTAETIDDKLPLIDIHEMLGLLYATYHKDSLAMYHIKSGLEVAKGYKEVTHDKSADQRLLSCYLDVAIQCVAMGDYNTAIKYVDSCYLNKDEVGRKEYADAVYADAYIKLGEYEKAQRYLRGVIPYLQRNKSGYISDVYYMTGQLNEGLNRTDSAIYFYKKAITSIDSLESKLKLKPTILTHLARNYRKIYDYKNAYHYMNEAKILSDTLFNIQSKQNGDMFIIKNRYRDDMIRQEATIAMQESLLTLNKKTQFRTILLFIIIIVALSVLIIAMKLRSRIYQIEYKHNAEMEQNRNIVDLKNRELTESALKFVEKEQLMKELLSTIADKSPALHDELSRMLGSESSKMWSDFNARFTQTNPHFFERLRQDYPDLTPTDLKHCALLQLNFDSKEMSHLLGISINSVHMARSRVRRKLGLKREDNLQNHLSQYVNQNIVAHYH